MTQRAHGELGDKLQNKAEEHQFFEQKSKMRETWKYLTTDQVLAVLPVTYIAAEGSRFDWTQTNQTGVSIPLVGGGEIILGKMNLKINSGVIIMLSILIHTSNTKGDMVTTPHMIVSRYTDEFRVFSANAAKPDYSNMIKSETRNIMANFDPKRDVDWEELQKASPVFYDALSKVWNPKAE